MLYKRQTFQVPAVGKVAIGCDHSTAMLDKWGKCIRCGEKVDRPAMDDHSKAIEYSKLRSSGVSVEEAAARVYPELCCTEKVHRFIDGQSTCACGTVATVETPADAIPASGDTDAREFRDTTAPQAVSI